MLAEVGAQIGQFMERGRAEAGGFDGPLDVDEALNSLFAQSPVPPL